MIKNTLFICCLIIVHTIGWTMAMEKINSLDSAQTREIFKTDHPQNLAKSILLNDYEFKIFLEQKDARYSEAGRIKFLAKLLNQELFRKQQKLTNILDEMNNNVLHKLVAKLFSSHGNQAALLCAIKIVLNAAHTERKSLINQANSKSKTPLSFAITIRHSLAIAELLKEYQ